tara:strand:- start:1375 stop:1536 length:162 start_codon:yes stop_codon:yes gene_type:complete
VLAQILRFAEKKDTLELNEDLLKCADKVYMMEHIYHNGSKYYSKIKVLDIPDI